MLCHPERMAILFLKPLDLEEVSHKQGSERRMGRVETDPWVKGDGNGGVKRGWVVTSWGNSQK